MAYRFFEGDQHAALYARYRPNMPAELADRICDYVRECVDSIDLCQAVDVGCGQGQGARLLAPHFRHVLATDISAAQISQAEGAICPDNITFSVAAAEKTPLPASSCQLILAASAAHWFDMPAFFAETRRLLSPGGVLALVAPRPYVPVYEGCERYDVRDYLVAQFCSLGEWTRPESVYDYQHGYTSERYRSPFCDHQIAEATSEVTGTVADMIGFCSTWTGFQRMQQAKGMETGADFLRQMEQKTLELLGDGATMASPILMRTQNIAWMSSDNGCTE